MGGGVTPVDAFDAVRELDRLPRNDFRIAAADFTGTLVTPEDLKRIRHLSELRELLLPAYMWNEGAGSSRDSNERFEYLSGLKKLEKLQLSVHFLTNMNIQDNGLALIAPLTGLTHLRLAQSRIHGKALAPFVNLRSLDVSYSPFDDSGMMALAGMTHLERLVAKDTLITDKGMKGLEPLREITELNLYGCRITDTGLASIKHLTKLTKLNLLGA